MDEDELAKYYEKAMMGMSFYEGRSEHKLSGHSKKRSLRDLNYIKANIRDIPLQYLVELLEELDKNKNNLPNLSPEKKAAILKARIEIQRRAFKDFTVVAARRFKGPELGFLRKPKY